MLNDSDIAERLRTVSERDLFEIIALLDTKEDITEIEGASSQAPDKSKVRFERNA